ncbi:minor tail protein [Arthrobacter phage Wyborn]|uniref:Minor tail protein n=1 Tax=Arthrobacter phage Wyborn TaxID=3059067 RepID=A0AA96GU48_9CAUD|nr:minor tail protein [Arthrobacter phage Wyborn]
MRISNKVTRGSTATTGWNTSTASGGVSGPLVSSNGELIHSLTTASTSGTTGPYLRENFSTPLGTYSVRAKIKAPAGRQIRLTVTVRNDSTDVVGKSTAYVTSTGAYQDFVVQDILVPTAFTYVQVWAQVAGAVPVGEVLRVRDVAIFDTGTAPAYFNGSSVSGGGMLYGWDGTAGASMSWQQPSIELLHEWTRRWWESLPNAYRMADAVTDPGVGYFPLLRWMDGIGSLAGEMRDLSDSIWFGGLTDLKNAPESSLRWLAQLLGLSEQQRAVDAVSLRSALLELTSNGRAAVGTRASIGEAAKRFLTGEKQVTVVPSSTTAHTIVLLVRSAEVPGGDLAALAASVRGTGVIPAGHNVIAVNAVATWDSFMAAAGVTWDELDGKAKTWSQHDTLGVDLSSA